MFEIYERRGLVAVTSTREEADALLTSQESLVLSEERRE